MKKIQINGHSIGDGFSPYIVAEISANHNGDLSKAKEIIRLAKDSGADAVKLQTYTPDTLTIDCNKDDFLIHEGVWAGYKLYDLYKEAYTPFEWHQPLFDYCAQIGITCFSTPFDESAVDLLEQLDCPAYKIASFEIVDLPLIKYVARTGKPMIISTGMANEIEIQEAVNTAKDNGCKDIILLHCISSYPAPIEQSNILTIPDIAKKFNTLSGLSDHTIGTTVSIAAVALGACFIEKHFTISREDKGPDSGFSLEPEEFKQLCQMTKDAWRSLGVAGYDRKTAEEQNVVFRRSIYFVEDTKKGSLVTEKNIKRIRPGYGLSPKYYRALIGQILVKDVSRGDPVTWADFEVDNDN